VGISVLLVDIQLRMSAGKALYSSRTHGFSVVFQELFVADGAKLIVQERIANSNIILCFEDRYMGTLRKYSP